MFSTCLADSTFGFMADSPLLAALPVEGGYFGIVKLILFTAAFVLWAYNSAWTQKDLSRLRVPKGMWVPAIYGTGILCLVIWLAVPMFWVSFGIFVVLYGTVVICYAVFHNRRVSPGETILTPAHMGRLFAGGGGTTKRTSSDAKDRVRLKNSEGKKPAWPTDPEEHAAYAAMQELLFDAIWRRCSDIRLDLLANQPVKIIYKVDGVDRAREPIDAELAPAIFAHLKRISGMDPEENRRPQSGSFQAAIGAGGDADKEVEIDLKTSGSTAGQRMLLKLFSQESKLRLEDIGLTKAQLDVFGGLVKAPKGVILVSGPRGSGVTSTLYAILRGHDAFMQNIHTMEVSKAMDLENITQHVYHDQDGSVSFGKRFRSILRTEPDVAMAGDTPDTETAALAAASGRQGKKIYLGMNAKDTFSALRRYLEGVNDNALAASSLLAVTSQRLARVLCTDCRRAYKPDPKLLKKGNLPTGGDRPFYRPPTENEIEVDKQGNPLLCPVCQGTGYIGRTAVIEVLLLDDDLRAHVAGGAALQTLKVEARKKGMLYLQEVALHKVYEGQTSINEVLRVTKDPTPAKSASKRPRASAP